MMIAGIRVRDEAILGLAWLLHDAGFEDTTETLVAALEEQRNVVALTIDDREAILRALDDPPHGLAELRSVLLEEQVWRVREGLVSP